MPTLMLNKRPKSSLLISLPLKMQGLFLIYRLLRARSKMGVKTSFEEFIYQKTTILLGAIHNGEIPFFSDIVPYGSNIFIFK